MGNDNIKSNIDSVLIDIVNEDKIFEHILYEDKEYHVTKFIKSKKLNLLQRLILSSNDFSIKKYLTINIYKYKNEINYQNEKGWTALMMACVNSNNYSNNEIVKLLLENGADLNLKDVYGNTALMLSCINSNTSSNIETVKLLLENGADINLKNDLEYTALMLSCMNSNNGSNIETFKLLLDYEANINLKNINGYTALMLTCRYANTSSDPETIKLILNQTNIDANIVSRDTQYNALMLLCQYNSNQLELAILLKSKINFYHINSLDTFTEKKCLPEYKKIFIRNWDSI